MPRFITYPVRAAVVLLVALVGLSLSWCAHAQGSATLSCTAPTQYTDGQPITAGTQISYKFYRGTVQGTYPNASPSQSACSYVWTGLPVGLSYFVATSLVGGVESVVSSPPLPWLVPGSPPNPPMVPQPVTIAGPVFNLAVTNDSLVLLEAGSVVAGRPCDPTQQIAFGGKSYMRVDASRVTAFPGQQILAAWAVCQ